MTEEVIGTYFQKWNPSKFRFLINGSCYPLDINNWLGIWWSPIWLILFSQKSPKVTFQLVEFGRDNPNPIGQVKTEEISFKNVPIISSKINVVVDMNLRGFTEKM